MDLIRRFISFNHLENVKKENVGKRYSGCISLLSQRKCVTPCTHLTHHSYLFRPTYVRVQYGRLSLHHSSQYIYFLKGHMKFLHFHGQPEARLNRDQSVHGVRTNQRTWFIKTISIFLFSAPDVHLRTLQKMWVDGIMHKAVWETSLKKMNDEWIEFILYVSRVSIQLRHTYPHQQNMF